MALVGCPNRSEGSSGHSPNHRALECTLQLRRTIGQGEKVAFCQALALIPCIPAITLLSHSLRSLNQCALVYTALSPSLRSRIHHKQCCSRMHCALTITALAPSLHSTYTAFTALSPSLRHCAPHSRCPHIICPLHSLHSPYSVCVPCVLHSLRSLHSLYSLCSLCLLRSLPIYLTRAVQW